MARSASFLTPLAASLILAGAATAQQDPIGDLLGGAPETAPTATPPVAPQPPSAAQPVELDEDGQPIPPQQPVAPTAAEPAPPAQAAAPPETPPAVQPPPQQAVAAPPVGPAPVAPQALPPQAIAPPPIATPPAPPVPEQALAPTPPPAAAAPLPTAPIPYQTLGPSAATPPPLATAPAYVPPAPTYVAPTPTPPQARVTPPAPYVPSRPPTTYAAPTPGPAAPPAYAPYASPPMGLASAPPPSTNVRPSNGVPVNINERDRTPDSAPTYRELDYEQRLRASYASAQGLQGPLDGTWILAVDGDDLYSMELVDRSSGVLEGVWRDLRRTGSISGSGFVEDIQRYGGQLTFRFQPDAREAPASVTLAAGPDGRWTGELTRGGKHKPIILRRN